MPLVSPNQSTEVKHIAAEENNSDIPDAYEGREIETAEIHDTLQCEDAATRHSTISTIREQFNLVLMRQLHSNK